MYWNPDGGSCWVSGSDEMGGGGGEELGRVVQGEEGRLALRADLCAIRGMCFYFCSLPVYISRSAGGLSDSACSPPLSLTLSLGNQQQRGLPSVLIYELC